MSTQRVPFDDSHSPEKDDAPILETWEPLMSEAEAVTGAETPHIIELPPPEDAQKPEAEPVITTGDAVLRPGEVLAGRYEIQSLITDGALGPVYSMLDRYIRDREALCILPKEASDARSQRRLSRGIESAKAVRHSGIAALFDLCDDPERNLRFVTMEGVEGMSLAQLLRERDGRLPVWEALDIARRLSEALSVAHRHAEHFCLNPRNIIVLPDVGVKILELGLADALPRDAVLALAAERGTEPYLAPELRNRFMEGDARADVYSLGVILYEMLTGRLPEADPMPPSEVVMGVPAGIDRIVLQCLRRRPEERPKNMRLVERALRHLLQPRRGYPPLWVAGAASFLLVCAAVFFMRPTPKAVEKPAPVAVAQNTPQPLAPVPKPAPVAAERAVKPPTPAPVVAPVAPRPATPKPAPKVTAQVPPPTPVAPVRSVPSPAPSAPRVERATPPTPIETEPIVPRVIPAPVPTNSGVLPGPEGASDVTVARTVPPATVPPSPPGEVPAPTAPKETKPPLHSARGAALRAQREAQSAGADRSAPDDYKMAAAALEEGDTWTNAGWTDDAEQQYKKAEQYFRRAIRRSLEPLRIPGPIVEAPANAPRTPAPAAPNAAPAHSLEFLQLVPDANGTLDRAEIAFNLLGGGQRRQVYSVGDEIADGWRLESIDPATQSIRLRAGTRVVSLAPSSRRTPAPSPSREARLP